MSTAIRLILVDDEPPIRRLALRMLADSEITVVEAAHGHAALTLCEEVNGAFDVMICDYKLPDISGVEVVQRVRERWPSMVILLTSGNSYDVPVLPDVEFLAKPFYKEDLLAAVRAAAARGNAS